MATTPMFAPDGTLGDIPQERAADALKAGFKQGQELVSPDGRPGVVPIDRVQDALSAGFVPKAGDVTPGGARAIGRPQTNVEYSNEAALRENGMATDPKMGQMMNPQSLSPGAATAAGGVAAAGGLGLAGYGLGQAPVVGPALRAGAKKLGPVIGPAAASYAINRAKELPVVGPIIKHIPFAEYLPFLFGGGKSEAPPEEPPIGTDQMPGRPYQPNPRYQPQPQPEPLPQRNGPLLLNGEVQQPPKLPFLKNQIQTQIEQGLGNEPTPIQPNVPIRQQPTPTGPMPTENIPAGHIRVESSALKSYRYDPDAREFHVATKSGGTYIYGDVPPEQAQAFGQAESKGQAFQQIKANNPLVGKVVNGKRIAVKPVDQGNDLTDILRRSLQQVQQRGQ